MDSVILKQLLTEYEEKRRNKIISADERKQKLLEESSEYRSLEDKLHEISLSSIKSVLSSSGDNEGVLKKLEEKNAEIIKKKAALLKKLNLPEDYLEPSFDCKECQDTGYVGEKLCTCIRQKLLDLEYNKSNIGNLEKENFGNFDFQVYSDTANKELYNSTLSPRENIRKIYTICKQFVDNFDDPDEKNLMFLGPTGLGKTFLSNCIAKEILDSGKTVLYQTAPVMLDELIQSKFDNDNSFSNQVLNVDLLIIDDLGTETMNNLKFTELFTIINSRLLNQSNKITKTIISTNLDLKDLFEVYNERIGSRIAGNYNICRFFGEDIRLKK